MIEGSNFSASLVTMMLMIVSLSAGILWLWSNCSDVLVSSMALEIAILSNCMDLRGGASTSSIIFRMSKLTKVLLNCKMTSKGFVLSKPVSSKRYLAFIHCVIFYLDHSNLV